LLAVGLGGLLLDFQGRFDAAGAYAVIVVMMTEALLLSRLCHVAERRSLRHVADGAR
jgi:ABC-type nitrate/sulfonate/bicarbonate transport system permease component